ncbi:response regulator [Tenacibaculum agarivorans]|uniref:response regulator n=1 Tax=Tenacibaculum agarivorans TaxID=1908389 RepID=UPI00094B97B3|nr:response regulator [Tenacibaculum agarivorans]
MSKLNCILLIDDDAATNMYHKIVIDRSEIANHVQVCIDGQDALNYLTNKGEYVNNGVTYPRPVLIFLDINMPGMNGFEFLDAYQLLPEEQKGNLIIMMLTTSLNEEDKVKAKSYKEVSGFLNKPLSKDVLDGIIEQYF